MNKIEKIVNITKIMNIMKRSKKRRRGRIWSRNWLLRRDTLTLGACNFVENELLVEDEESYKNYLRMDRQTFEKLHSLIENDIKKIDTQFRASISSRNRLMVTLRFFARGETFKSLSYSTRIAPCTISKFIPEVLSAIYQALQPIYLRVPEKTEDWEKIANEFYHAWNIPNTIGAIDGKHITFSPPRSAGSHYYNYKGTHSIVLLAIADANYKLLFIDVGTNGRISDGGVFEQCDFNLELNRKNLNLPEDKPLPQMENPVPYVILADAAFPLQRHLLKPYPFKSMTREQRVFNYRLSRGRRVVENAFGIMAQKFRVLLNPISLSRDKVVLITQTCCSLHNFIKIEAPSDILDMTDIDVNGQLVVGSWRESAEQLQDVRIRRGRPSNEAILVREEFKCYFNNHGQVEWQNRMI